MEKNSHPLVAIKCFVYNHEPYLRECLDGFVMQQTDFPFVAIVHDDASTDHSADIIREYAAKYPDIIHPIYETENQYSKQDGSLGRIMDAAINATGAKYIAMCEGDDYWTDPHKLQKQVDYLEAHKEVGLCYTDCDIYYEDNKKWERAIYASAGESFNAKTVKEPMTVWYKANNTWLYRKSISDNIEPNKDYIDGALYFLYNMCLLAGVEYIDGVTAVYRRHIGSASCFAGKDDALKKYLYNKNCFLLEDEFVPKFPNSNINLRNLYNSVLYSLYERAFMHKDTEILNKIDNYFSPLVDMQMFRKNILIGQQLEKIQHSHTYRLGHALLAPFKWLKSIL